MSTEKGELKPCPFCGPRASTVNVYDAEVTYGGGKPFFKVGCGRCGSSSGLCKSEADATDLWNNRMPMPESESAMSTEKDREAAESYATKEWPQSKELGIDRSFERLIEHTAFLAGIQHARQGERERMVHLLCWHEDSYSDEQGLASKVDEFLEQESK